MHLQTQKLSLPFSGFALRLTMTVSLVCIAKVTQQPTSSYNVRFAQRRIMASTTTKTPLKADMSPRWFCRLRTEAYNGQYHYLPFLVTDLAAQPAGYATAEPCMDS